jgi:HSP20 family protein
MIERYDPFGRAMSLRQMMDRLLEDAFIVPREGQMTAAGSAPLNVYEEGDNVVVEAQLPGTKPEDIDVRVERGTLTIRAETKADEERQERSYLVREHRRGTLERSLRLPETVDPDACQASFENGVLRLTFPRSEQAKPRRISVTAGGQQALTGDAQDGASTRSSERGGNDLAAATGSGSAQQGA